MTELDLEIVNSTIEEEKDYLNFVSQEIWKTPELCYKEVHAHALLTCALKNHGFKVQKHYFMPTAFRAEYSSTSGKGKKVAILLEYDALPEIGHACGHNLIAEAGLAAAFAVKSAMEQDPTITGKIAIIGTPAEEGGGGKIKLLELGAFDDVDAALMVHPAPITSINPVFLSSIKGSVHFKGKESHAGVIPWNGINALDAAVACYQHISLLRQHIKPTDRINVIITKGGQAVNITPANTSMEFLLRSSTIAELKLLLSKVEKCITGAAEATSCEVEYKFKEEDCYENLITNKVLMNVFQTSLRQLNFEFESSSINSGGSTDMGNVSHKLPSIHPLFNIPTDSINHSKEFTKHAGAPSAQQPTLLMGKAMALTSLYLLRNPETLKAAMEEFQLDILEEFQTM